mmetsp:Transcript_7217/g.44988  ORF Transcript_7217/g.44988 Transcript_7217/m.44988 type:complete len:416 (-) Transcript_7217:138-1385(-)
MQAIGIKSFAGKAPRSAKCFLRDLHVRFVLQRMQSLLRLQDLSNRSIWSSTNSHSICSGFNGKEAGTILTDSLLASNLECAWLRACVFCTCDSGMFALKRLVPKEDKEESSAVIPYIGEMGGLRCVLATFSGMATIPRSCLSTGSARVSCFDSFPQLSPSSVSFGHFSSGFLGQSNSTSHSLLNPSGVPTGDVVQVEQCASQDHHVCVCSDHLRHVFHLHSTAGHQHGFWHDVSQRLHRLSSRRIDFEHRCAVLAPRRPCFRRRGYARHEQHVFFFLGHPRGRFFRPRRRRGELQPFPLDGRDATDVVRGTCAEEHVRMAFGDPLQHVHGVRRIQGGLEGFQSRVQCSTRRVHCKQTRTCGVGAHPQATDDPRPSQFFDHVSLRTSSRFLQIASTRPHVRLGHRHVPHPAYCDGS